jgi:isoamylase
MTEENWSHDYAKSLGIYKNGSGLRTVGPKGEMYILMITFTSFLMHIMKILEFQIPVERYGTKWMKVIDTAEGLVSDDEFIKYYFRYGTIMIEGRSVLVLKQPKFLKK